MRHLFFITILLLFTTVNAETYKMPTGSMEPTIEMGALIDVDLIDNYKPKRGELIIIIDPNNDKKSYIKRCIAIEGDLFEIKNGFVYINKKKQIEAYTQGQTKYESSFNINGIVKKDSIVILGDCRDNSLDSRYFGYVPLKNVKGRVTKISGNSI